MRGQLALAITKPGWVLLMKNYIWDFDGMLFDSYPHIATAFQLMMKDFGKEADYSTAKALLEITFAECYNYYGVTDEMGEKHHFYERQFDLKPIVKPFPNTYKTLEELYNRGAKNFLYTHRGFETSQYYLKKYDMAKFFTGFVDSSMNFPLKPAPDAVNYICDEYSLDKKETIMIGDREIDVLAGKNAGVYGCLFTKDLSIDSEADYKINDIIQVLRIKGETL